MQIVNCELLCEETGEWFNEVECRINFEAGRVTVVFPNGVEVDNCNLLEGTHRRMYWIGL